MFSYKTAFYQGKEKEGYTGIAAEDNFFLALEVEGGLSSDKGDELMKAVKDKIKKTSITDMASFELFLSDIIKTHNLPAGFSLASGYLKDEVIYLKTAGSGRIIIKRGDKVATLISKDKAASGYVEKDDLLVFTTDKLVDTVGGEKEIVEQQAVNQSVALFIQFNDKLIQDKQDKEEIVPEKLPLDYSEVINSSFKKKKTITFIVVAFLFFILVWSVILGVGRRSASQAKQKISLARDLITQNLSTAEDVAYLNMNRALVLISESKDEVNNLKKQYKNNKDVSDLEKMVTTSENKILKKEEKNYSEFFDLAIDDKQAKGDKLYLDQDNLLILDKARGVLYTLSLSKKSFAKKQGPEIKSAEAIALSQDKTYFYTKSGIYQIDNTSDKAKKVIGADKDWGQIVSMGIYNGNIYLLDKGKDDIYKYLNAGDSFSNKDSYFASGQGTDLSWVTSMTIDGSVYLSGGTDVIKFTAGMRDGFKMDLPDPKVIFSKIFTTKDLNDIYGWDRDQGVVYVMDKNGGFINQIKSGILSKATDLVVYNNSIYVVLGSKIYKIE